MVWSQRAELRTPPIATTDFLYLRFIIGDRTIDEKNFGRIQKDRVMEMKKWAGIYNNILYYFNPNKAQVAMHISDIHPLMINSH
jgi:hypothetical protein